MGLHVSLFGSRLDHRRPWWDQLSVDSPETVGGAQVADGPVLVSPGAGQAGAGRAGRGNSFP